MGEVVVGYNVCNDRYDVCNIPVFKGFSEENRGIFPYVETYSVGDEPYSCLKHFVK